MTGIPGENSMLDMLNPTRDQVTKFQQEHEVSIDAQHLETPLVITVQIPKKQQTLHQTHYARKFITSRNEGGSVLIVVNPDVSNVHSVENQGEIDTFEDFVEKTLAHTLEDREESDQGPKVCCGASCS
jgi:hypothetical protein